MKRRLDTALPHETKRNRSDTSLDEETELSSQGSLMVLGEIHLFPWPVFKATVYVVHYTFVYIYTWGPFQQAGLAKCLT